jgi:DNA-binding IclR family transcriptional regulator
VHSPRSGRPPDQVAGVGRGHSPPTRHGAGGLAILCALPPDEAESIIDANAPNYEKYGFVTAPYLREAINVGREKGYAFLDSVVTPGTAAFGIAFPPENPIAAISVAAISGRLESPA